MAMVTMRAEMTRAETALRTTAALLALVLAAPAAWAQGPPAGHAPPEGLAAEAALSAAAVELEPGGEAALALSVKNAGALRLRWCLDFDDPLQLGAPQRPDTLGRGCGVPGAVLAVVGEADVEYLHVFDAEALPDGRVFVEDGSADDTFRFTSGLRPDPALWRMYTTGNGDYRALSGGLAWMPPALAPGGPGAYPEGTLWWLIADSERVGPGEYEQLYVELVEGSFAEGENDEGHPTGRTVTLPHGSRHPDPIEGGGGGGLGLAFIPDPREAGGGLFYYRGSGDRLLAADLTGAVPEGYPADLLAVQADPVTRVLSLDAHGRPAGSAPADSAGPVGVRVEVLEVSRVIYSGDNRALVTDRWARTEGPDGEGPHPAAGPGSATPLHLEGTSPPDYGGTRYVSTLYGLARSRRAPNDAVYATAVIAPSWAGNVTEEVFAVRPTPLSPPWLHVLAPEGDEGGIDSTGWGGVLAPGEGAEVRLLVRAVAADGEPLPPGQYRVAVWVEGEAVESGEAGVGPLAAVPLVLTVTGSTAEEGEAPLPSKAVLGAARPNPTAGTTALPLVLPAAATVEAAAFDVLGRRVALLHEGVLGAGRHRLVLGAGLPAGVYVVRARVESTSGAAAVLSRRVTVVE